MAKATEIQAVVVKVYDGNGEHFAVAEPKDEHVWPKKNGNITFSLGVWEGNRNPRRGQIVRLSEIEEFRRGWRAMRAAPVCL